MISPVSVWTAAPTLYSEYGAMALALISIAVFISLSLDIFNYLFYSHLNKIFFSILLPTLSKTVICN